MEHHFESTISIIRKRNGIREKIARKATMCSEVDHPAHRPDKMFKFGRMLGD